MAQESLEQEPADQGADQANDHVADQAARPLARHHRLRQGAGDDPHDDPEQDMHGPILRLWAPGWATRSRMFKAARLPSGSSLSVQATTGGLSPGRPCLKPAS